MSNLQLAAFVYFSFAFSKFMLCMVDLPAACGTLSRLRADRGGASPARLGAIMCIAMAITCILVWPIQLFRERLAFFNPYGRFSTIRSMVKYDRSTKEH